MKCMILSTVAVLGLLFAEASADASYRQDSGSERGRRCTLCSLLCPSCGCVSCCTLCRPGVNVGVGIRPAIGVGVGSLRSIALTMAATATTILTIAATANRLKVGIIRS